ncbi:MAG: DUF6445 family protein [Pseudomonadota bacterium]
MLTSSLRPRPALPYVQLEQGRDFWIIDNLLEHPDAVRARILARQDWQLGYPHAPESWPGKRVHQAFTPEEMHAIESRVAGLTGIQKLWVQSTAGGARLDHNVAQLVGAQEGGLRPHTDSRALCRYAAVLYLSPGAPPDGGTSFFRLRYPDGSLSGNLCPAPHKNLVDALQVRSLPLQAWQEDSRQMNVYNRMIIYKANLVHSATGYFGSEDSDKRLTAVFFWMTED